MFVPRTGIKIKGYKCFRDESGFDDIKKVNIIIGRNNSGKSSLLDIVDIVCSKAYDFGARRGAWRGGEAPEIYFESIIDPSVASRAFPDNRSGGAIHGSHGEYGRGLSGRRIKWRRAGASNAAKAYFVWCDDVGITPKLSQIQEYANTLVNSIPIDLEGKRFFRLTAERDIIPEKESPGLAIEIHPNGRGLTHAIQSFINVSSLPSNLVEKDMLGALNDIFSHDAKFNDIVCQIGDDGCWEIYLEEESKGRIPLSRSGSGLKTVIAVLSALILVPHVGKRPLSDHVFGFEELENNLHPALLRRLSLYIYKKSLEKNFTYFITTHSNVLIDQFSRQDDAQIIHVMHNGSQSTCKVAKTYIENNGILDDLDVRASDILQSNGIIWVEGPSDRIYLNRWIDLWAGGSLMEGTHYQIIFYGGRLLSHLSAAVGAPNNSGISILQANRNSMILIDSDKRNRQAPINQTKRRIIEEFNSIESMSWITKGREIENYIPASVLASTFSCNLRDPVPQYGDFFEYLNGVERGAGNRYRNKKMMLAEKLAPSMTLENMQNILDIDQRMNALCEQIKAWNK